MNKSLDEYDRKCKDLVKEREQVDLSPISVHIREQRDSTPISVVRSANGSIIQERYWHSPCCKQRLEVSCVKFVFQYIVLTGALTFFSVALYKADTCESTNLYQSLVLLILGIMIPSPSVGK